MVTSKGTPKLLFFSVGLKIVVLGYVSKRNFSFITKTIHQKQKIVTAKIGIIPMCFSLFIYMGQTGSKYYLPNLLLVLLDEKVTHCIIAE